jgi:orotate phosphoribosyltransferase
VQAYQKAFIELAVDAGALTFGEFELKSGRISPYFFNAGMFNTGEHYSKLARFYAQAIVANQLEFDVLFGPAYKGIPIASTTAMALVDEHQRDCNVVFNRKEAKTHGEGGNLIGAELKGSVAIIDDVITAGTAIRQVIEMVEASPEAHLSAILVAIDRQERGQHELSAIQELEKQYKVPVVSIVKLEQVINFVKDSQEFADYLPKIEAYRSEYGTN